MYLTSPSWSNMPSLTILKLTMCAPSSKMFVEVGGIEPGRMPPISAWCPREAVKNIILLDWSSKTGLMIVISGKCLRAFELQEAAD